MFGFIVSSAVSFANLCITVPTNESKLFITSLPILTTELSPGTEPEADAIDNIADGSTSPNFLVAAFNASFAESVVDLSSLVSFDLSAAASVGGSDSAGSPPSILLILSTSDVLSSSTSDFSSGGGFKKSFIFA